MILASVGTKKGTSGTGGERESEGELEREIGWCKNEPAENFEGIPIRHPSFDLFGCR